MAGTVFHLGITTYMMLWITGKTFLVCSLKDFVLRAKASLPPFLPLSISQQVHNVNIERMADFTSITYV